MDKTATGLIFGALLAIWWTLIFIGGVLGKIANILERMRQDNIAWRQNVWDRDR